MFIWAFSSDGASVQILNHVVNSDILVLLCTKVIENNRVVEKKTEKRVNRELIIFQTEHIKPFVKSLVKPS